MKVTNEQLNSNLVCIRNTECGHAKGHICNGPHANVTREMLLLDLIEARAMIRDMRSKADLIHECSINPILNMNRKSRACEKISEKILEISKEYQE